VAMPRRRPAHWISLVVSLLLAAVFGARPATAQTTMARSQQQRPPADCPPELACEVVPAAYQRNSADDPSDYGNYDVANRGADGPDIRYVVIHNTEISYDDTVRAFQNSKSYVSAHYVIRASDGKVIQMVHPRDVAWTAGNWYVNTHAINIEHEGFAIDGRTWYTDRMYEQSAALVRYLAAKYGIPLDRAHILGHDDVPAPIPSLQASMHWDPGPFWDWNRYMALIGAAAPGNGARTRGVVTIAPDFATNQPPVSYCPEDGCRDVPLQGTSFVYLYTAPSFDAPLIDDPALPGPGTTQAFDWGDKAAAGQTYYRVATQGDWDAIFFGGQVAWFHNPGHNTVTAPGYGWLISPADGLSEIPVYGRAYPEASAYPEGIPVQPIEPMQYTIPAGQIYVARDLVHADYYWSPTQDQRALVKGLTPYYLIFFNHRLVYVKASDVRLVWNAGPLR
jgi:N-acetyl-anhydromuramyl-L-alanine amidase AmpD